MTAHGTLAEWLARMSRVKRAMLSSTFIGWVLGSCIASTGVPHPMLHLEWDIPSWRQAAAERSLTLAPIVYFGPIFIGALAGYLRYRRGWDGIPLVAHHISFEIRSLLPIAVILVLTNAALLVAVWYFLRVVGRA